MKTLKMHGQAEQGRAAGPSGNPQGQPGREPSAASTAIADSPRMTAQREEIRGAFGPIATPVQLRWQREVDQALEAAPAASNRQASAPVAQAAAEPAPAPNRTGMPDPLKAGIESLSGMDMSEVRVHRNSSKPAQLNALAYAQGNSIHLAPGQERHLPHEAWHVVQQRQGRVRATMQMAGVGLNEDAALESEADVMGGKAAGDAVQLAKEGPGPGPKMNLSAPSTAPDLTLPIQRVRFLAVKRIAQQGSLYEGIGGAGPPALAHNGGLTWWGPRATALTYAAGGGSMWRSTAANALNLVDMSAPEKLGKTMRETIRRTNNNLSPALQGVLQNHDFAYAVPQAVAQTAQMCLDYASAQFANQNGQWTANPYVTQVDVDNALQLAQAANEIPLWVGSVIQNFADHGSPNALQLDDPNFLANPDNYVVLRKDATNLDAGFADALLADLNQPNMAGEFHGLHVPAGMKFGGFTDTKHEILIRNSPANLTPPVAPQGGDPDLQVSDKTLGVDDSLLARAWRWFGLNN